MENFKFIYADYRDGRVTMAGKTYPAGIFIEKFMNQYFEDDTAARIVIYWESNLEIQNELSSGYVDKDNFVACNTEIQLILRVLPRIFPFQMLDVEEERKRIEAMFSEETFERLHDYLIRKGKMALHDPDELSLKLYPPGVYSKELFKDGEKLVADILETLKFYQTLGEDIRNIYDPLQGFLKKIKNVSRFDEAHLLPIALEEFRGSFHLPEVFPLMTEYVSVFKNNKSSQPVTARRLYFDRYYSFLVTDLFEGLHYGHYVRQCPICGRFFLMQSARRQKYCNGLAPELLKGKPISCRKLAARQKRKELAEGDPVKDIYKRRCAVLRMEKRRCHITEEFAARALSLAKEHMQHAVHDNEYANKAYPLDMSHESLYAEAEAGLK